MLNIAESAKTVKSFSIEFTEDEPLATPFEAFMIQVESRRIALEQGKFSFRFSKQGKEKKDLHT